MEGSSRAKNQLDSFSRFDRTPTDRETDRAIAKTHFLSSVFINIVFITFSPRAVNVVKCLRSIFFYLRHFNIDYFTLHYITYNTLCDKEIQASPKIKVLPSGTLSKLWT